MRKRLQKLDGVIHAFLDTCAVILAGFLSERMVGEVSFYRYLVGHFDLVYLVFVFVPTAYVFDLYYPLRDFRRYGSVARLLVAVFLFGLVVSAIDTARYHLGHHYFHSAGQLGSFFVWLLLLTYTSRLAVSLTRSRVFVRSAILIGDTAAARLLMQCMADEQRDPIAIGFRVIGFVAKNHSAQLAGYVPYLGAPTEIPKIRRKHDATLMIYAMDVHDNLQVDEMLVRERLQGMHLVSAIGLYQSISGRVPYRLIDAAWLIEECLRGNRFGQAHLKNLVDKVLAGVLALVTLPILVISALLIKLESEGPVLFTQRRIGQHGRPFTIYKLRTMRESNEEAPNSGGAEHWHAQQEQRITRIGNFMRRIHIDELPQLFNVLKGDMSLVGPRPEMEVFIRTCEKAIPFYRLRLDVKPGITGWAQVAFRHTSSLESYQQKFEYELYYLSHRSLQLDLEILARTVFTVLFKRSR